VPPSLAGEKEIIGRARTCRMAIGVYRHIEPGLTEGGSFFLGERRRPIEAGLPPERGTGRYRK
jgi:hypothetical protein